MKQKKLSHLSRRDVLKSLSALPFLGYFTFGFKGNISKEVSKSKKGVNYLQRLKIGQLESPEEKLKPPTGNNSNSLRLGLVGHGWRGEQLMRSLSFEHREVVEKNLLDGQLRGRLLENSKREDLNVELTAVCDTFEIHANRGTDYIDLRNAREEVEKKDAGKTKIFPNYREMIANGNIDAIIIATPDHTHAQIAIDAAKAGIHVFLEKPMTHSIEEAVELKKTIKSTGVIFQLGHENRQQMSFKMAREMYRKGVLGIVSMIQAYTNKNGKYNAWIRERKYDHLGNPGNINWKEFLGNAPWNEFDPKRYFNWHRYSDYGTGAIGNNFSHRYDCINQVMDIGIPESVVALGGQYYYKNHGDMPDVMNAIFSYPERGLTMTYDCTLKNGIYRQLHIIGSDASMDIDRAIYLYKDESSERYKDIKVGSSDPLYYYQPNTDVDAVTSATAISYIKSGYGPTYIDGKVIDATFLHLKEWVDAIRGHGSTSCNINVGFEEAVTFNMANLAYEHKKVVKWDKENEKAIIG